MGSSRFAIEYDADDPTDFDYDNLLVNGLTSIVEWNGTRYIQLQDFIRATGQEQHGLNVTPRFVAPDAGNYSLSPNSQLIDAGVLVPGINDDFWGNAPTPGRLNFQTTNPTQQREVGQGLFTPCLLSAAGIGKPIHLHPARIPQHRHIAVVVPHRIASPPVQIRRRIRARLHPHRHGAPLARLNAGKV